MKKRLRYYFNRLTGFRYVSLEKKITWEIRNKNWSKAAALLDQMKDKESYRYYQRVVRSVEVEELYNSVYASTEKVLERIKVLFKDASIKKSVTMKGGIASIGLSRHDLKLADGTELSIFEKVYVKDFGLLIVQTQDRLFHHIGCKALSAPEYYGYIVSDQFVSSYQGFIHSDHARTRFRRIFHHQDLLHREELVYRLWSVNPSASLEKEVLELESARCNYIQQLLERQVFIDQSGLSSDVIGILSLLTASLPRCIMHGDLNNPANVIRGKDHSTYILDWDSWIIVPVGWGLLLSPEEFRAVRVDRSIREFCKSNDDINPEALWLMIAFYNLVASLRKNNIQIFNKWESILSFEALKLKPSRDLAFSQKKGNSQ